MANRYVREDKERRMGHLGIIDQDEKIQFIDEALNKELTRLEAEVEE